ncbi:MAG: hypothetical protein ACTSQI_10345 [Candidatus Helarchaeota archaeon]
MSVKISWREPTNRNLIFILVGLAIIIQFLIVRIAVNYFLVNSVYVFIFTSIGIIVLLSGVELILAQITHSLRIRRRQSKHPKKRKKLAKISEFWSIMLGAGIALGLFCSFYFICSYFLIDPLVLLMIPTYGKFALAEILSGIILIIFILFLDSIISKK